MSKIAIIVIGPQGSGKGTQAKMLAKSIGAPIIETGALLRSEKEKSTPMALKIRTCIDNGLLVPKKILQKVIRPAFKKYSDQKVIILDGIPRTLAQKPFVEELLKKYSFNRVLILCFILDDQTSIERLKKRAREDDSDKKIMTRLKIYHQKTDPLISALDKEYSLSKIDASKSIDEIAIQVKSIYNSFYHEAQ